MELPTQQKDCRLRKILLPNCNPLQPEATPNAPTFQVGEDTPWSNTMPAFTNLFKARADWPIPSMPAPTMKVEKMEVPPQIAAIPHAMVLPKNNRLAEEKCIWRLYCPICKKEEEDSTEVWDIDQQRKHHPQNPQHHQTYDVPDQYSETDKAKKRMGGEDGASK